MLPLCSRVGSLAVSRDPWLGNETSDMKSDRVEDLSSHGTIARGCPVVRRYLTERTCSVTILHWSTVFRLMDSLRLNTTNVFLNP
jgi:hypothetical protein